MDIPSPLSVMDVLANGKLPVLIVMIILVFLSAFFSMSETAINSCNRFKLENDSQNGKKASQKALWICDHYDSMLTTILVGNNIVNILLATLSVSFFAAILNDGSLVDFVSTLVVTVVVLIFGEIVPKTLANRFADKIVVRIAFILYFIHIVLFPISIIFRGIQVLLGTKESTDEQNSVLNEEELLLAVDDAKEKDEIEDDEAEMIHRIMKLNDREVKDIMTPRLQVVAIDEETPIEDIKKVFFDEKYSRIPVYRGDKDHIIGVLYERDFMTNLLKKKNFRIKSILRKALFVTANSKIDELIRKLQMSKVHIAMVSGEYGDIVGIVTMEDALEEIVGEIYDEHDDKKDDNYIEELEVNHYRINTQIYLEELFEELELGDAPQPSYSTLSVWLYSRTTSIPEEGTKIEYVASYFEKNEHDEFTEIFKKLTFVVTEVENRTIMEVELYVEEIDSEEAEKYEDD